MCGFIGKIAKAETGANELLRGLPQLRRRGPDSQRLWSSADRLVSLFHARLAIVDKDPRARQPLSDTEAGVTVVFVGEIYNYTQLKQKFPQYRFRTNSDTEVILASYAAGGTAGLSLLKGPFSLVIVDERQKRVVLARDAIGKKPLFFARWEGNLLFGTSLLSLIAVHKKLVNLNKDTLPYFWKHSHINPKTTVLQGASPVLPGEVLEFDWHGSLLNKTSCEPEPLRIYEDEPLDEVIEITRSLLMLSVRRRLSHNPNPIILLSGGIDSTVVNCIMKQHYNEAGSPAVPKALTLASLIPLMNDEFYALYAARRTGTELQRVNPAINVAQLGELIIKALDLQDEPLGMPSFFLLERLVNAMSRHGKILISGDGGDEAFLGYGKPADWHSRENEGKVNNKKAPYGPKVPLWMSPWGRNAVTDTLVGHMLAKADRASAEQGVELRCPLLDWDLVSYARSLPFEMLVHGGQTKALLKDQLRDWPHWFLERPKLGFTYNLRWLWWLSRYSGLREGIDRRAIAAFEEYLPQSIRRNPLKWKSLEIFQNFEAVWRLLAWSRFLARVDAAKNA